MTHTPGPWQVGHHLVDPEQKRSVHSADGWTVCIASRSFPQDETFANMYLIAESPNLLEACEAFVEAWDKCLQLEKTGVALRMARAAIAKARNEKE